MSKTVDRICQKFDVIKLNSPKVREAGKLAILGSSETLHGYAAGETISINDITDVEHDVGVQLSSDTITDFSGIKVTVTDNDGILTTYTSTADGTVEGVKSRYPSMSFTVDTEGVIVSANYIKDIDKALSEFTSSVALLGGE
jgi:hypothetical protein